MGIRSQARDIWRAVSRLPFAVAKSIGRILEAAEALFYVAIAVGLLLILAEVNYGLGIVVKEGGHIGYESARVIDEFVNAILGVVHGFTHFFHIHWRPPYVHLEDHLIEFKSSNIHSICSELASYTAMFLVFPRMRWSPHICPVLRYFTGTPIDVILNPIIGWASYDSAPEGNNCRPPSHLAICIFCEFFYLLRLVAYALIFVLIAGPTWPVLSDLLDITFHTIVLACDIFYEALHAIFKAFHEIENARFNRKKTEMHGVF